MTKAETTIEEIQSILDKYYEAPEPFVKITDAYWKSEGIIAVEINTNIDIDIKYWYDTTVHFVENYIEKIDQKDGQFTFLIEVNEPGKDWNVQAVGEQDSNSVHVGAYSLPEPEPEYPEPSVNTLVGLHDRHIYDPTYSICRTPSMDEARKAQKQGQFVYFTFSHRWLKNGEKESRDIWKRKIEGWMSDSIKTLDPNNCVFEIQDEPLSHHHMNNSGFTSDDIHFLYHTFKRACPEYKFGFSHTKGELNRHERYPLPQTDFMTTPLYAFYQNESISREEFHAWCKAQVDKMLAINANADIYVIGQGFYNDGAENQRWGKPPLWAPEEYAFILPRLGVRANLYWTENRDDTTKGLNHMPEYLQEIKKTV